jgi:hypothetical protein
MINAELMIKNGVLEGIMMHEIFKNPIIEIGDYFILDNPTTQTEIVLTNFPIPMLPPPPSVVTKETVKKEIDNANYIAIRDASSGVSSPYSKNVELLQYFVRTKAEVWYSLVAQANFTWANSTLSAKKKPKVSQSIATRGILAKQESLDQFTISWVFSDWNEFKFQGKLAKGKFSTK